jgi:hypothetical protein
MRKKTIGRLFVIASAWSLFGAIVIASTVAFATTFTYKYWYVVTTCGGSNPDTGYTGCGPYTGCTSEVLYDLAHEWSYILSQSPYSNAYTGVMQDVVVSSTSNQIFDAGNKASFQWGINGNYTAHFAMHGASLPVSVSTQPTFYIGLAMYPTGSTPDCTPNLLSGAQFGAPYLKFLMMLSCDSMNVASDLPAASNQQLGRLAVSNGVHIIAGFSGVSHGIGSISNFSLISSLRGSPSRG